MPPIYSGLLHQKEDAVTLTATANLLANRIIGYDGGYATSAGGGHDAQGVSETGALIGEVLAVVTEYSYLVEGVTPVIKGAYIKPAADGSGRGEVGSIGNHCGRALTDSIGTGNLFEMQIVMHFHP